MLGGRYRDVLVDARRRPVARTPWRRNLVVDGAFTLLAGLLRGEPGVQGILYWAVGAGEPGWDAEPPAAAAHTSRLAAEVRRLEVPREAIRYVDARGAESSGPTPDLEVRLTFAWPQQAVTLREFGVFGGDAAERADSGVMINHAIHPRIDLEPGQRLERELRLSLGRGGGRRLVGLPAHWLSDAEARVVAGVGAGFASALSAAGIATVDALARSDPHGPAGAVPPLLLIELREKARLVLRVAAQLRVPATLAGLTVSHALETPPAALADATGAFETEVVALQEQLATLELALDHRFLGRLTLGSLVEGAG